MGKLVAKEILWWGDLWELKPIVVERMGCEIKIRQKFFTWRWLGVVG